MKRKVVERAIASMMAVVLAVGLMPLPAFAEQPAPDLTTQAVPGYIAWKTIDGLGIGSIGNPQRGAGGWDRVYFGSATPEDLWLLNDFGDIDLITPSEPVLFNVLNNHETYFSSDGEPTMLLDCANVQYRYNPYHYYANPNWNGSYIRTNLRDHYTGYYSSFYGYKPGKFTEHEFLAIKPSTKTQPSPTDGPMWPESPAEYYYEFAPLNEDRVFILDAQEAMNESYGFPSNHKAKSATRKKSGGHRISDDKNGIVKDWWLRSNGGDVWDWNAIVKSDGSISGANITEKHGVSPALNLKLSSILFTTYLENKTYKLTVRDDQMKVKIDGDVVRHGATVTVPYVLESDDNGAYGAFKVNRYSIIATDAEWDDEEKRWSTNEPPVGYFMLGQYSSDPHVVSLPERYEGYNLYLIAEHVSEGNATDYASDPVKIDGVKKQISAIARDVEYEYDGKAHGIWLTVTDPFKYTVAYGLEEGTYDLDKAPMFKVTDGPQTVYYKVSAQGHEDLTGSATINITPRTVTVGGITAADREYDGTTDATLDCSQAAFSGVLDGDAGKLSVSATGAFDSKNAGADKEVTISDLKLEGDAAANYRVAENGNQKTTRATITKKPVTVSNIKAEDKTYDNNRVASLDFSEATFSGKVDGDDLSAVATGTFVNVGPSQQYGTPSSLYGEVEYSKLTVNITGITLTGADAGNYVLASTGQQESTTAVILPTGNRPEILVAGAGSVTYDREPHSVTVTVNAPEGKSFASGPKVEYREKASGMETVFLPESPQYWGVGYHTVEHMVSYMLSGEMPDFIKSQAIVQIVPRPVTVSGVTATKVYDGTTYTPLDCSNAAFDGIVEGDELAVSGSGSFSDANVGENKTVTVNGLTLGGNSNYTLDADGSQKTCTTASITARPITITAKDQQVALNGQIQDGADWVAASEAGDDTGLVPGHHIEGITLSADTSSASTNATITPSAAKIVDASGTDVTGNYSIEYTTGKLTVDKADSVITADPSGFELLYDGQPHALVSNGACEGGTMTYALSADGPFTAQAPVQTDAGSYQIWYRVEGDSNHNDLGPFFVQSTITRRPIVIQANDQTVELNKAIAEGTDQVTVKPGADEMATALATGDHLGAITLTGDTTMLTASGEIAPSDWEIEDFQERDVTENYAIEAKNGVLTVKETEHVWGEPTYEWTDDNRSVTAKRVDTRDASFVQTETAAANATVSRWPTCTSGDKTTTYRATFENPAFTMQTKAITENVGIDENAHRWGDWVVTKEPTATQDGEATRTCQYSEAHTQTRVMPATGGSDEYVLVEESQPTCEKDGNVKHWVKGEGSNRTYYIAAGGDDSKLIEVNAEDVVIKAQGHVEGEPVKEITSAPTCEDSGSFTGVVHCSRCGVELYRGEKTAIPPLGHDWSEWVVTKEATATEDGLEARTCSRCDKTETHVIPATGGQGEEGGQGEQGDTPEKSDLADYAGAARKAGFTDLDDSAWYMNAPDGTFPESQTLYLDYTVAKGLMSGYTDEAGKALLLFGPRDMLSRAQVATILYRMAQPDSKATTDPASYEVNTSKLPDVESKAYYTAAVNWCVDAGVITGYEDEGGHAYAFGPNDLVTREQLATMIFRYCTIYAKQPVKTAGIEAFADSGAINKWAREGVSYCLASKIMEGYTDGSNCFGPQDFTERCQMAKVTAVTARMLEQPRLAGQAYQAATASDALAR